MELTELRLRPGRPEKLERTAAMVALRERGASYSRIALAFGVSKSMAIKVVKRAQAREKAKAEVVG